MIRVGAVNIDTSHPMGFAESMQRDGRMQYVGVYNDSFRSDKEVEGFVERFGLEKRCETLEELAAMCDIGFIQGCNWDDHLRCAEPFIRAGKPVFLDKPAVGSVQSCRRVRQLVKEGAVIIGSSSARYAYEIQDFLAIDKAQRGEIVTVIGSSGVDEFNYGVHIAEAIGGLMGCGAQAVRYVGRGENGSQYTESYFIRFADGRSAVYTVQTGVWQPFGITVLTTKNTYQLRLDPMRLYYALMERVADYMQGRSSRLQPISAVLESVEIMLAGAASRAQGGAEVRLDALTPDSPAFDGAAFCRGYGAAAGAMYAL